MTKIITHNSNQIGGNVVVIETSKSRIAIDFGENLPGNENANIEIEGLSEGQATFDGVFFTHYHGDHVGRMKYILPEVPLYVGEVAKKVMLNINSFIKEKEMIELLNDTSRVFELKENTPVSINDGDIVVTPYTVDHSAYEAFMFLIETKDENGNPDRTILHTGDYRGHGYRGEKGLLPMIHYYIRKKGQRKIDALITEGTMLSRMDEDVFTEGQLQVWAKDFFEEHRHVFVICSSTNLDTLASFYHAGVENRMSMFGNNYIFAQLKTFTETAGKRSPLYQFHKLWSIDPGKQLQKGNFSGTQEDYMRQFGFVCVVKEGEFYEGLIDRFKDCNPVLIYSMWDGYLNPNLSAYNEKLAKFCNKYNYISKHTSGHATADIISKVITAVNPQQVIIPIHTEHPELFEELSISDELKKRVKIQNEYIL